TMMTCHLSIRPAATCTVPRTQLLAASCRHVAASYWTAASEVAPTSAWSTPSVNDDQHRRITVIGYVYTFCSRFKELPGYDENQFKISLHIHKQNTQAFL
nr:hypothetical protein [Tanacetum cinerariifolium]